MKKVSLIAFPFAGGNSRCYHELAQALPADLTLVTHELPGHGLRMKEPLQRRMPSLVNDVLERLGAHFQHPYALYGHSFGAALALEVTLRLREGGREAPLGLFVSGRRAPKSREVGTPIYQLPSAAFHTRLARYGGTPAVVLQNAELMAMFERILRADLEALETPRDEAAALPLAVPIRVMLGRDDDVTEEQGQAWQLETTRPLLISRFDGGHFFIKEHARGVVAAIADDIRVALDDGLAVRGVATTALA
jgi:medium-chain acyl-[acyl-carrier-protein] hydrolase